MHKLNGDKSRQNIPWLVGRLSPCMCAVCTLHNDINILQLDSKPSSSSKVHHIPAFLMDLQICIKNESNPDKTAESTAR